LKTTFLAIILSLASFNAFSAYTCAGTVTGVGIDPKSGDVLVEHIGPLTWPRLCNINNNANDITPDTCKVIYSTLLTAQSTKKKVRLWFNDDKDCSAQSHTPWYMLTGWYFGPVLEDE